MTAEIVSLEDQLQSHEVTKVGINDRIKKLELENEHAQKEMSEIQTKNSDLKQEKDATTKRIANLEETNNSLKAELSLVQKAMEAKPPVEEPVSSNNED
jgi:chromosome segregation ATPase